MRYYLFFLCLIVFFSASGCKSSSPEIKKNHSTDVTDLERRLRFPPGSISESSWDIWYEGEGSSRFLPTHYITHISGFLILAPDYTDFLYKNYSWEELGRKRFTQQAHRDLSIDNDIIWFASSDYMRALVSKSPYHLGRVFLSPTGNAVFFELKV